VKIVLDTTILVRANEHTHGLARELLVNIVEGEHKLLLSNEMLHELARVLRYPRLQEFYRPEIVTLDPLVSAPIRDVNDIIVMQTAIIGESRNSLYDGRRFFRKPRQRIPAQDGDQHCRRHHADASLAHLMVKPQSSVPQAHRSVCSRGAANGTCTIEHLNK
jgi:hypothetical protein